MEVRRRSTTVRQLELMLQFLEGHQDLALGRVRSKEARNVAARLWRECAAKLNSEGPVRTGKEWAKVWNDYKCRVRTKLVNINDNQRGTGGGPSTAPILTALEERVASILGRDVGPLPNVRQDQFASNDGDVRMVEEVFDELPQASHQAASPIILNVTEADNQDEYMVVGLSPIQEQPLLTSPVPSVTGQAPSLQNTPRCSGERVRRGRETQRLRIGRTSRQPSTHLQSQSSRSAMEESRSMILRIEQMRAEAALKTAEATSSFAESFRLIAESIDRCSQKLAEVHVRSPDQ